MKHSAESQPVAYSIKNVCEVTSLSKTTIYAAIACGELRITKCGRRTLVMAHDLHAWLASCAEKVRHA